MVPETSFCSFRLGDFLFGVQAGRVQEVLRGLPITPVPLAPPGVMGLLNLRGQVVNVLDLKKRLGLKETPAGQEPFCVILKDRDQWLGLLVDEIGDVLEPSPDSFEEAPANLNGEARKLIRGAYKLRKRLLLVLDLDKALDFGD
jgi:purine-binding chemotaxis protein CheW